MSGSLYIRAVITLIVSLPSYVWAQAAAPASDTAEKSSESEPAEAQKEPARTPEPPRPRVTPDSFLASQQAQLAARLAKLESAAKNARCKFPESATRSVVLVKAGGKFTIGVRAQAPFDGTTLSAARPQPVIYTSARAVRTGRDVSYWDPTSNSYFDAETRAIDHHAQVAVVSSAAGPALSTSIAPTTHGQKLFVISRRVDRRRLHQATFQVEAGQAAIVSPGSLLVTGVYQPMSGAAVINCAGELVGVVVGHDKEKGAWVAPVETLQATAKKKNGRPLGVAGHMGLGLSTDFTGGLGLNVHGDLLLSDLFGVRLSLGATFFDNQQNNKGDRRTIRGFAGLIGSLPIYCWRLRLDIFAGATAKHLRFYPPTRRDRRQRRDVRLCAM